MSPMDANDLAQSTLARLCERKPSALIHVSEDSIRAFLDGLDSSLAPEDKAAFLDALRLAQTAEDARRAAGECLFVPLFNHWWLDALERWDEIERDVEGVRRYIAEWHQNAIDAREGRAARFIAQVEWFEKTLRVWEAMQALRLAFETGVGVDTAAEQFGDAIHEAVPPGDWGLWRLTTRYTDVSRNTNLITLKLERWLNAEDNS
jgi:hypothetical protein